MQIFPNDGMPQLICNDCRIQTVQAYKFKTTCKKADDALKLYLATGKLVKPEQSDDKDSADGSDTNSVSTSKKRTIEVNTSPEPKRARTTVVIEDTMIEEGEIILHHIDENTFTLDEHGQEVVQAVHNICMNTGEEMEEGDEDDDGRADYLDEDEEDITHPTLKVSQVKTDVFPCNQCERSFPLQQLLDIHMQNHNRERKFGCDECGRKFFSKYDLGKHYLVHTGDKPFTCSVCHKAFSRESLLHRHEKIHVEVPKYLCTQCDRTFLTRDDLDSHSEKHKKRRPFQCKLCNKSFVFKQGLERHEVTHSDAAAHKCNYCEASFSTPGKLARHITSHAGIRPYPCKVCSRTFLLSHHLTRHMRTSHGTSFVPRQSNVPRGNGQHKCDVCSMSFRRKDSLINHTAIHSMVNLKCIICNTSFPNAKLVKDHITTHLTGLPYPCDKCEYSFDTQQQLEEHEVKHVQYVSAEEEDVGDEEQSGEEYEQDEYIVPDEVPQTASGKENVRKSARSKSIKNYAQFLKDELGSDSESNLGEAEDENDPDVVLPQKSTIALPAESIKPVVRSEGTKMYQRKVAAKTSQQQPAPRLLNQQQLPVMASEDEISQPVSLEHLGISQQTVNEMPNKKFIDMKIGEKIVRVKKLMMTKAEIEAMAKQGKIAMKGNTLLLKNDQLNALQKPQSVLRQSPVKQEPAAQTATAAATEPEPTFKQISIESIIGHPKPTPPKPSTKKTYVKKAAVVAAATAAPEDGEVVVEEETVAEENTESSPQKESEGVRVKKEPKTSPESSADSPRRSTRQTAAAATAAAGGASNQEKVLVESAETIEGQQNAAATAAASSSSSVTVSAS